MAEIVTITSDKCDGLRFVTMDTKERLGQLFDFYVQFESSDTAINLSGLLGSPMTITLATEDGFKRYFNGIVVRAGQIAVESVDGLVYARYEVSLAPKPWLLQQKVDCRIYKQMSVPQIVQSVLGDIGYTDIKLSLSASYAVREYCVQYREDCLNFISRLMEMEGIYYYFTHANGTHTMVLADGIGAHQRADGFGKVTYLPTTEATLLRDPVVTSWVVQRGVDKSSYSLTDYNPLTPKASLSGSGSSEGHTKSDGGNAIVVFDFPGTQATADVGKHLAQMRAEALTAWNSRYSSTTTCCSAMVGGLFALTGHPDSEMNQEYLIVDGTIQLHAPPHGAGSGQCELSFACRLDVIESSIPYRSMQTASKPIIGGLQTAIVTGSDTDEDIAVDQYGRVQVNFHWNMPDKPKAQCSCPVRVASPWAGKSWGAVSLPRVGQEVVVSFLEGDPDRPLIIGSVYNAANTVPYGLPDNKTQSGIKSRSLLGGTDDFNELRFEDKKGSEDFFMHAQKDMHEEVENDHVVTIDHDETITVKNDQTTTVKHDQTLTVDNNQTETVKNNRSVTVQNDDTLKVSNNGSTSIGQKFKLDAGTEIELVCGASSIKLTSSGDVEIKGVNIKVTGDATIKMAGQASVDIGGGASVKVHSDAMMNVEGGAMTTVKGAMLQLTGDGMAKLGGGITMIG